MYDKNNVRRRGTADGGCSQSPIASGTDMKPAGPMSLADWRDGQLAVGLISPPEALVVCRRLATYLDGHFGSADDWPSLCPECVEVETSDSDASDVSITAVGSDPDAATPYCAPEVRNGAHESPVRAWRWWKRCVMVATDADGGHLPPYCLWRHAPLGHGNSGKWFSHGRKGNLKMRGRLSSRPQLPTNPRFQSGSATRNVATYRL